MTFEQFKQRKREGSLPRFEQTQFGVIVRVKPRSKA